MRKILALVVIGLLFLSTFSMFSVQVKASHGSTPNVICVPFHGEKPAVPHDAWIGKEIILKGTAHDKDGDSTLVAYKWDFGDGYSTDWISGVNPYIIEAKHTYTGIMADGTPYGVGKYFTAWLYVKDNEGLIGKDCYFIAIRDKTLDVEVNVALDNGLWWLHKQQIRSTYADGTEYGYWYSSYGYHVAFTAAATEAFELLGHLPSSDRNEDPYAETVQRGLNYLFNQFYTYSISQDQTYCPLGNPDMNGNGIGLACFSGDITRQIYESGMALMTISSSRTPDRIATTGTPDVLGRSYKEIVQDMVDFMAWAQSDPYTGVYEGGWRYYANYGQSDNSVSQWPVIGMEAAERNFGAAGVTVPDFVRPELLKWLAYSQGADGGFGYTAPGNWENTAKTGAGCAMLYWAGVPVSDTRFQKALDFLNAHWYDTAWSYTNFGDYYTMYAIMKGMRIPHPNIEFIGTHNWYAEYVRYIVDEQNAYGGEYVVDHSWLGAREVKEVLATAWAMAVLIPTLVMPGPVADAGPDVDNFPPSIPVKFDASGSYHRDPAKSIVLYEWDFESDGIWDYRGSDTKVEHAYPACYVVSEDAPELPSEVSNRAAILAKEVIGAHYTWGGQGWNWTFETESWKGGRFLDAAEIKNGYYYYDPTSGKIVKGYGLDCSGLIFWSYNKVLGTYIYTDSLFLDKNAQGQWEVSKKIDKADLRPGDLLFFNTPDPGDPDHVAMYVGGPFEFKYVVQGQERIFKYNVVEATAWGDKITTVAFYDITTEKIKTLQPSTGDMRELQVRQDGYGRVAGTIDWVKTAKDYSATLRVTDNSEPPLRDTDTRIICITPPPWKPVADPDGPYEGYVGFPVRLDGSKSYDPESKMYPPDHPWYENIAKYEWDLDNDGQFDDSMEIKPSWIWDSSGTYSIGLRVTDSQPSGAGGTFGSLDVSIKYTTVVIREPKKYKVAYIPVRYTDTSEQEVNAHPISWVKGNATFVEEYFRQQSFGSVEIISDIVFDEWKSLGKSFAEYGSPGSEDWDKWALIRDDAIKLANINENDYNAIVVIQPQHLRAFASGKKVMLDWDRGQPRRKGYRVIAHELGHALFSFGDYYMTDWLDLLLNSGNVEHWCLMGGGDFLNPPAPIMSWNKIQADWLKKKYVSYGEHHIKLLQDMDFGEYVIFFAKTVTIPIPGLPPMWVTQDFILEGRYPPDGVTPIDTSGGGYSLTHKKGIELYRVISPFSIFPKVYATAHDNNDMNTPTLLPNDPYIYVDDIFGVKIFAFEKDNELYAKIEPHSVFDRIVVWLQSIEFEIPELSFKFSSLPSRDLDVDLRAFTIDGKLVGMDYVTNKYRLEIEGARTGGNTPGCGPEWISVPLGIEGVTYFEVNPHKALETANYFGFSVVNMTVTIQILYYDSDGNLLGSTPLTIEQVGKAEEIQFTLIQNPDGTYSASPITWEYIFEDQIRHTVLKISTDDKYFQFIAPDKEFLVKHDPHMKITNRAIVIIYKDWEIKIVTVAVDTKLDFCVATAWDQQTSKRYFLIDKVGNE